MIELNILNQIPLYIFWKDVHLRYLGANTAFLRDAGLKSNSEIIGKTDFELPWKIFAEKYRADDVGIINNKTSLNISEKHIEKTGQLSIANVNKKPLIGNDGQLIGIMGIYTKMPLEQKFLHRSFPKRQRDTLECLIQGLTAKETAVKLGLSMRTVESYLTTLKSKLGCKNKTELIKKVLLENLLAY